MEFDEDLMIPDKGISIDEGAITVYGWQSSKDKEAGQGQFLKPLQKNSIFR